MRLGFAKHRPMNRDEQLAAKPVRAREAITDGAVVKAPLQSFGPFRLPRGAMRKFELDTIGLFVWELCDGDTTLLQIIQRVAHNQQCKVSDAETATLKFMHML